MIRMRLCWKCLVGISVFACTLPALAMADESEKPNILFFITDDESWLERSAYGWSKLPTPHFDRVARQGVLFTNGFTSAPSCAPSRGSVLTGRNFWELKQGALIQAWLPKEFPLFPQLLANQGYHVGSTHKVWGPGVYNENSHGPEVCGKRYEDAKVSKAVPGISTCDYAANFKLFLEDRRPGQPFFFWAGLSEPHGPYGAKNHELLETECGFTLDDVSVPPTMEDTIENRRKRANFLYEICYADRHLGRMLAALEAIGELENTLVVVTSDNGTSGIPQSKATPYDLGVHEPLAMMWPQRVASGRTVTDFVSFADFAPTFLEVAGIKPPAGMTGRSVLPLLESVKSGRIEADRSFIVTGLEWHGEFDPESRSGRAIRDDNYAYVAWYGNVDADGKPLSNQQVVIPTRIEFYDLVNDPWQQHDLANDPEYAKQKERLARKLREVGQQTGDPRVTGEMDIFRATRQYVQERKRGGYKRQAP